MMWQTQTTIEYPFALRPASIEEAGLFYSQMDEAEDAVLGTVGHIRMDFGASGKEFYHTWWPHNGDQFNTGEFKDELQKFVDMLRSDGPLTNLASMRNYCYQHGGNDRCILQRMDLNLTAVLKTTDFECGTGEKEAAIRQLLVKFHLLLSSFYIV